MKQILIILSIFVWINASSQNTDSVFKVAREAAYQKNYNESLKILDSILIKNPSRTDVISFIASVYSWRGDYKKSMEYIEKSLNVDPSDFQVTPVMLNILYWSREYNKLLTACDYFEARGYDDTLNLAIKRADALKNLEKYDDALSMLNDSSLIGISNNKEIRDRVKALKYERSRNSISVNYSSNFLESGKPQHFYYLEYSLKINKNTFVPRLNYNRRFGRTGFQGEIDYYRKFGKGWYMYLNYGERLSESLFPKRRAGYEIYFPIGKYFAGSIGGRHLFFDDKNVFVATASISKYGGKYWLALRPFVSFKDEGQSISLNGTFRRYFNKSLNYWGIELSYGNSPDDRLIIQNENNLRLISYKAKAEVNFMIGALTSINISTGYNYEEYYQDKFRNRYIVEIGYKIKL